jgi:hypothetical protein
MAIAREKAAAVREVRAAVAATVMKMKVDDSFAAASDGNGDGDSDGDGGSSGDSGGGDSGGGDSLALVPLANPFPSNPLITACNPLLVDLVSKHAY